jgi:hypothetical protein
LSRGPDAGILGGNIRTTTHCVVTAHNCEV